MVSVACSCVWKLLSFINSIIIAFLFGAYYGTDIYFYLIMAAGIGSNLALSYNTNVVIPHASYIAKQSKESEIKFLNLFIYFYIAAGFIFIVFGGVTPGFWLNLISRFNIITPAAESLFVLALIYFAFLLLTQLLINILERHRIFGIAYLSPLNAALPLLLLLCFHKTLGVAAMLCGFIAAQFIQSAACVLIMFVKLDWKITPSLESVDKNFIKNSLGSLGGEILVLINSFLPLFLMTGFGSGVLSALNYAKQIFDSPTEIITNRITAVTRIKFNELSTEKNTKNLADYFYQNLTVLLLIMTPVAVFTAAFSYDIVTLFFKRGSFSSENVRQTSLFVSFFMPSIILLLPVYLHRNLASAERRLKEFFKYQFINAVVFAALILICMRQIGPLGYPVAFFWGNVFWLCLAPVFLSKYLNFISHKKTIFLMLSVLVFGLVSLAPSIAAAKFIDMLFLRIFICGSIYVVCFALLAYLARGKYKKYI